MPPLANSCKLALPDDAPLRGAFDGERVLFRLCTLQQREPAVVGMSAVSNYLQDDGDEPSGFNLWVR